MTAAEAMTAFSEEMPIEYQGRVYDRIKQIIFKKPKPGDKTVMALQVETGPNGTMDINVAWAKVVKKEEKSCV